MAISSSKDTIVNAVLRDLAFLFQDQTFSPYTFANKLRKLWMFPGDLTRLALHSPCSCSCLQQKQRRLHKRGTLILQIEINYSYLSSNTDFFLLDAINGFTIDAFSDTSNTLSLCIFELFAF